MKLDLVKKALLLILVLAFIIRIVFLNISPPGFNADEAALGYNAYSLLQTGKDEWGYSFPLVFKSFSDYKPGLYVYLAMPSVFVFGLNEFSVRLPSIILGSLSVLLIYILARQLFNSRLAGIFSAFLLAFSPWHIHFSRGAWETNIATFFILAGIICFLKALDKAIYYVPSAILFCLSIYAYQSTRLITPLLLLGFLLLFYKEIFKVNSLKETLRFSFLQSLIKKQKPLFIATILSIILLTPIVLILTSSAGLSRFQGVSIFSDKGPLNRLNEERGYHKDPNSLVTKLFHNKQMVYGNNFLGHYLDHFTVSFLFTEGDMLKRNKLPETSQLYFFEIITVLFGLFAIFSKNFKYAKLVLFWIVIAPIAASLTYQTPHALRAHNMVIPLVLISGLGLSELVKKVNNEVKELRLSRAYKFKVLSFSVMSLVIIFFITLFIHEYFVHLPKQYALEWEYGFSDLVKYVEDHKDEYEKVIITSRYDQPYILYLFYSKYDPRKYQFEKKEEINNGFGFTTIRSFDKFEFREIEKKDFESQETQLIITDGVYGTTRMPLKIINFPNGEPVFKIYKNK